ncbi:MAG: PhzF family phenazine biosynthesis protein, partial [Frankiaceae bacterium]|nr:PhzF family phenazine biosynthesis protein [Arenimonas sp.]
DTFRRFHTRNPFTSAALFEDPATAAGAAALAGRLRDLKWPHAGAIEIVHGEQSGHSALIRADIAEEKGSPIRISGQARFID